MRNTAKVDLYTILTQTLLKGNEDDTIEYLDTIRAYRP